MDRIDSLFTNVMRSDTSGSAMHVAIATAKKTLNCYYSLTDLSEVYQIAMGMYSIILDTGLTIVL